MTSPVLEKFPPRMIAPPTGWRTDFMTNQDGARLRWGMAPAVGETRAGVVLVPGFNEVIEKYFETIHDLTEQGLRVYALDWRGQGGSDHWLPDLPQRPVPVDYGHDVRDLQDFSQKIVRADDVLTNKKLFLLAHSMGGHIGLRHLHDYPDNFVGMMATAPMVGLKTRPFPRPLAQALARTMTRLGRGSHYVPGVRDWQDDNLTLAMKNLHSHDPLRRQLHHALYRDHPEWRIGGATFQWLHTAFVSLSEMQKPGYFAKIQQPVMMALAGEDHLIDPIWLRRAAQEMPQAVIINFPGAGHELWHELDQSRGPWLKNCLDFITENLRPAPAPKTPNKPRLAL